MTFEEAFHYAIDTASVFIDEEIVSAANMPENSNIFALEHPLYGLMAFIYPNLFLMEKRNEYDRIIDNPIRAQMIVRLRIKCLTVFSLIGKEFVDKITENEIDGIVKNAGLKDPRSLRRDLEEFFRLRPITWFCILASSVYNNRLVARSKVVKKKSTSAPKMLGTAESIRTMI